MAKKQRDRSELDDLHPEVMQLSQESLRQQQAAQQGDGRGRPGHAGQKGRDKTGRAKATFDISLPVQKELRALAAETGIVISDLAEAALLAFIRAYRAGQIDLEPYKTPIRSLKADFKLDLPAELDLFPTDRQP